MKKLILAVLALSCLSLQAQIAGRFGSGINQKIRVGSIITAASVTEPTADILWLKFNDGSGQLVTADVGQNAVIANAGGAWTTGADSVALHAYDAQGDTDAYTGTSGSPANVTYGANVITVCFWAYNTAWGTGNTTLLNSSSGGSTANTWWIYNDEGTFTFIMQGTTVGSYKQSTVAAPSNSAWHHIAVVFDASTATGTTTIYIDGVAQSPSTVTDTKDGTSNFAAEPLYIMARNGTAGTFWTGYMDDVRVYASALSAGQIGAVYANPE
jgi:hypothetical protein